MKRDSSNYMSESTESYKVMPRGKAKPLVNPRTVQRPSRKAGREMIDHSDIDNLVVYTKQSAKRKVEEILDDLEAERLAN